MKSKVWIIALAGGLVLVGGVIFFIIKSQKKTDVLNSPVSENDRRLIVPTSTLSSAKVLIWTDQAGFSFQYPDGLTINKHDEDSVNYAHIDFISKNGNSSVLVMASDAKYKTLDDWVKNDKSMIGANIIDSTLGGKPAKKMLSADGGSISIGTIDSGILFTIGTLAYKDSEMKDVSDRISSTFKFVTPTSAVSKTAPTPAGSSGSSSSNDEGIIEEEETIQ